MLAPMSDDISVEPIAVPVHRCVAALAEARLDISQTNKLVKKDQIKMDRTDRAVEKVLDTVSSRRRGFFRDIKTLVMLLFAFSTVLAFLLVELSSLSDDPQMDQMYQPDYYHPPVATAPSTPGEPTQ
jgi:hypothetical protein